MAGHLVKIVCEQVEFKSNRFMFWCRTGEWVFTTKWRIYQGIWERNILTVGTLKACFTSCSPFHRVSSRSGTAWGSLTNWHLPLCLRPEGSSEEGGQGNLISLCLFLQSSAKLAFFGNWALMPGVWERLEVPRESEEWFAARRWLSSHWALERQGDLDLLISTIPYVYAAVDTSHGTFTVITSFIPNPPSPAIGKRQPGIFDKWGRFRAW